MESTTDYYAVLGVERHADTNDVKIAFKKLALKYHPDVYKGADAEERMRVLLQAYQTLSDPARRREYDARRADALLDSAVRERTGRQAATSTTPDSSRRGSRGEFIFPALDELSMQPTWLHIGEVTYQLKPAQTRQLKHEGLLRGTAPEMAPDALHTEYYCHRCRHHFDHAVDACPFCHARDWAEYLLLRCQHCAAVFESKEMRDPLRGGIDYHPYELFPLCPNCRRSHWCVAENRRVEMLRAEAARRTAIVWGSVAVVVILLLLVLVFAVSRIG